MTLPADSIVLEVNYRPGDPPTATVLFRAVSIIGQFGDATYAKDPVEITFTGDEARAIAREYLCPGARWA